MGVRDRHLRLLAGAIAVSAIGDFIAMIALSLRANAQWEGGGVAVLLICLWAPVALLAGYVGVLVDRLENRSLAIWSALFQAVVAAALAFTHGLVATFALAAVLGVGVAVSRRGRVRARAAPRRVEGDRRRQRARRVDARSRVSSSDRRSADCSPGASVRRLRCSSTLRRSW